MRVTFDSNKTDSPNGPKKKTNKKQNKLMTIVITILIVIKMVYKALRIAK